MEKRTKERYVMGKKMVEEVCVCTPSSSWRAFHHDFPQNGKYDHKHLMHPNLSARKLAAHLYKDTFSTSNQFPFHLPHKCHSTHQTEGANGGLMSDAARPSVQLLQALKGRCNFRSITSGTDISSVEIASYDVSDSASLSSTSIQAREPACRLGTSAEKVKVLNGMRNLENRQISSSSRLKALSAELHDPWKRIKNLHTYDPNEQQKAEGMVEKILEGRLSKNCRSQSESLSTNQALKRELDDERKRRKKLESLNRKLAQEIAEVKLSCSSSLNELEKERHTCKMMEDLCDKFANAILDRQSEATSAKQRRLKDHKLTCRMAEAWLDERTQSNQAPNIFISGKRNSETEAFHKTKIPVGLKTNADLLSSQEERSFYRRSSESFLLNEPGNQVSANEDNSTENDLSCLDQHKWTIRRKGTGSSTEAGKCSAANSHLMVNNLNRKYSSAISEHKRQTSDIRAVSTDGSSQTQHLRSKLTTSPSNQKQHSLAWKSKEGSLGSHLLEARKRRQYCTPSSGGSKSQNVCR